MDNTTMVLSLGIMGGMPDNAASSAAEAAASARAAAETAANLQTATVAEVLTYLGIVTTE